MCAVRTGENAYLKNDECWKKKARRYRNKTCDDGRASSRWGKTSFDFRS